MGYNIDCLDGVGLRMGFVVDGSTYFSEEEGSSECAYKVDHMCMLPMDFFDSQRISAIQPVEDSCTLHATDACMDDDLMDTVVPHGKRDPIEFQTPVIEEGSSRGIGLGTKNPSRYGIKKRWRKLNALARACCKARYIKVQGEEEMVDVYLPRIKEFFGIGCVFDADEARCYYDRFLGRGLQGIDGMLGVSLACNRFVGGDPFYYEALDSMRQFCMGRDMMMLVIDSILVYVKAFYRDGSFSYEGVEHGKLLDGLVSFAMDKRIPPHVYSCSIGDAVIALGASSTGELVVHCKRLVYSLQMWLMRSFSDVGFRRAFVIKIRETHMGGIAWYYRVMRDMCDELVFCEGQRDLVMGQFGCGFEGRTLLRCDVESMILERALERGGEKEVQRERDEWSGDGVGNSVVTRMMEYYDPVGFKMEVWAMQLSDAYIARLRLHVMRCLNRFIRSNNGDIGLAFDCEEMRALEDVICTFDRSFLPEFFD